MLTGNISDLVKFDKTGKSALYKDGRFHVMLLNLPEGDELKPHSSKTDAFCIVQKGEAEFMLEGKRIHIRKGDLFSFKATQEHSIKALTDFSLLLIK
jgi:quercetin dioxygenase-like cupin family protein